MKKFNLKPYKRKARWRKRRDEGRKEALYLNLIKNICPIRPNLIWVTDFTYLNIWISMSKKGSPWENGYQESFYNNFKTDLGLEFDRFTSVGEIITSIHQTIKYYNQERIHTTLKTSPTKFRLLNSLEWVSTKRDS